ncbi:MAG TPA: cytochrome c biogenesis protein CcsA, partial [Actinomycetota bacterium]|nr:cytochrome c biogenesis protein CcsA [Actinomycetota bacterium]
MDAERLSGLSDSAFTAALVGYAIAAAGYIHYLAFRRRPVWVAARAVAVVSLVAHLGSIVARGLAAGRVPWGNMYEYSSVLAALVVAAYLLIVEWRSKVRTLGGFALGFAVVTMAVARMQFYVVPAPLQPALNSSWLKVHVISAIVGSSLLTLGSLFTILFLVQ